MRGSRVSPDTRDSSGQLSRCPFKETMLHSNNLHGEDGNLPERIAILASDMQEEVDLDLVRCIVSQAGGIGMRTTVCDAGRSLSKERRQLTELLEADVDGLILSPVDCHQMPAQLRAARCPIVLVGQQYFEPLPTTFVGIDNCATAQRVFEHLRAAGCERIGFLAESDQQYSTQQRIFGYRIALANSDAGQQPTILVTAGADDAVRKQIGNLLSQRNLDAVICDSSSACYHLFLVLELMPKSVAEQLQIVTFSNNRWQRFSRFRVSAINQPTDQIASHALQSLIRRFQLAGRKSSHKNEIFLGAEIVDLTSKADRNAGLDAAESA
jgi:DNA-binding LacI/PurR family transcriptional regulator